MGRKVHPVGFRLNLNKGWEGRWFAKGKEYRDNLQQDFAIRNLVHKDADKAGVSRIEVERFPGKVKVIVFTAKPAALSLEAANPLHAHEWQVFETVKLPDGKVLIPGVLESKSNFIEHPELIAQRIGRYAKLVGRENVIAGTDCGYGTWVGQAAVDPQVVFAKLAAMAEGAKIASRQFW